MPIPNTDTDTGSDVTAATMSRFTLLCVCTEQACVVRVCMKTLKVLNISISVAITIIENRLPLPL